jgi:hypothetical protein
MPIYVIKDQYNTVLRIESSDTEPVVLSGEIAVSVSAKPTQYPGPGKTLKLIGANYQIVDDRVLSELKIQKNSEINAARLAANESYFVFQGKHIACDRLSRSDIEGVNGVVTLTGTLPNSFPGVWKAMDNTYVNIPDKMTWIMFYGSMVSQGIANFNYSQQLKSELNAATTNEQVENIVWNL